MKTYKTSFLFFLIYILVFNSRASAQEETDSLAYYYELSKSKNNKISYKLNCLNKLIDLSRKKNNSDFLLKGLNIKSYLYSKKGDYNLAISTAKLFLKKSKVYNDTSYILIAYKKLADYNRISDSLLNAFKYYNQHKALSFICKDSLEVIRDLRFISSIQYNLGLIKESESTAIEALTFLDQLSNNKVTSKAKIGIYNQLGIIYKEMKQYNYALSFYNKILTITSEKSYLNKVYNNIGNLYKAQQKYTLALKEFKKVYAIALELNNKKELAKALNNLALIKSKLHIPEALKELEMALEIRKEANDLFGLYSSYITLTEYFYDRNNMVKANAYSKLAYAISIKTKNKLDRQKALSFMIEFNNQDKIREYKNVIDSNNMIKNQNEYNYSFIKYNYYKKEKEAQENNLKYTQSELKLVKEKSLKIVYQLIGLLIAFISLFFYFFFKIKYKKEKIKEIYHTESRISKRIHDEVANDIYQLISKIEGNFNIKEDILYSLEKLYKKTRDISIENSELDVKKNYDILLKDLILSYNRGFTNIITKGISNINWKMIGALKKITLYRILQELMVNMKKHSQASNVAITMSMHKNKIIITYKDDGIGCNCKIKKKSGLVNMENRIKSINGTIIFESDINKGFKTIITI
ncbi:tetratricopeptide repeat-containing sensor histidine kinase [Thalassobellus citreus]|uniref:ATP-binding protein n=1 Tax=Thalassobellus citreus TaxID=3367752 RepID=UPI00378F52BC